MRTILKRIGKDITKPNFVQDEVKPLNFEQASDATLQKMRALQTDTVVAKSANTGAINRNGANNIPISDITGSRGLVSQGKKLENDNNTSPRPPKTKDPYIPISVVTGGRDITTVSPELRAYLLKGSPSATNAIPGEYADLANVLNKASDVIDFENWGDLTARQQLETAQKAGLSDQDKRTLLNTSSHYVETIAKIQAVFANRYQLGISLTDARNVAKELFDIANEKEEAYTRTGKYEQDAVFAPKALRWLKEKEDKILDNLTKNAGEPTKPRWYNGGNSEPEEDKETAADIHRRAKYADIDAQDATKQIEAQLMKNVANARSIAALSGTVISKLPAEMTLMQWFYNNVKKGAQMDFKNPTVWFKTFPDLPYPKEDQVYNIFGIEVSSSDLGNLNYALVGKALGIPEALLLQQAGAASLRDHDKQNFFESQYNSLRDDNYGDEAQDQDMINRGFEVYNSLY